MQRNTRSDHILHCVRGLQTSRKSRDRSGEFWIEGIRQFIQAFEAGLSFESIVVSPILLKSNLVEMMTRQLVARGVSCARISPSEFRSISICDRASGIGAIVRQHWRPLENCNADHGLCWLVIEHLRSLGNLGTILRTAEATGAGGVIFLSDDCDPFQPAAVRASMGGIFHLQLARATHRQLRRWAAARGVLLVGLSPSAQGLWTDLPPHRPMAILVGDERKGLWQQAQDLCHALVRLPMCGRADSLNVGVATGVMLYELVRKTRPK
ncbi:MAG TPA: RNA methyltransferase [Tepidisphaeraceae bacterium]|jgi:TrmH family RNA methyltransferase|nr:RNA methyltransferase [Tepidisphaeraceae bacterium]